MQTGISPLHGQLQTSKDKQTIDTFIYTWLENEHKKGSNEIASCVFNRLKTTDLTGILNINLFSDGCGGQHKNQTVLGMLCSWLNSEAPKGIKQIECISPVVCHSYIPPGCVFGRLERKILKKYY